MRKIYFLFFLIILFRGSTLSYAQNISTVAGNGTGGYNGDGIAATAAEIGPYGIAVDDTGNVYIADVGDFSGSYSRIRKVSAATGLISTLAGNNTLGYGGDSVLADTTSVNFALGVAVDHAGNIYIADQANYRVRKITVSTGIITTVAGNGTSGYSGDGAAATSAELAGVNNVFVDDTGNIYIADAGNFRIRKVSVATGLISTVAGNGTYGYTDGITATTAKIATPYGMSVDHAGNIYFADGGNNRVRKVTAATGLISTIAGDGTAAYNGDSILATTAELNGPEGLSLDNAGNIYIADAGNNRVRKIDAITGLITTIAGTDSAGYNGDGMHADSARLNSPIGLTLDNAGNMYVGDAGNYRVRKFALPCSGAIAGTIHTAGATTACGSANDTLSLPGASTGAGITYQWQSSTTGASWMGVGTLVTYITGTITATTYFRTIVTCTSGSVSDTSAIDTITVTADVTPLVTISVSPGNTITAGETATFTATVTNGGSAPTYQWKKNSVAIAGAVSSTYSTSAIADGDVFTCTAHSNAACAVPDSAVSNAEAMHVTSGVQQVANAAGLTLYPDPNNGRFTIDGALSNKEASIEITNVVGQVVYYSDVAITNGLLHKNIVLPGNISAGIYVLLIKTADQSTTQRFVISKK